MVFVNASLVKWWQEWVGRGGRFRIGLAEEVVWQHRSPQLLTLFGTAMVTLLADGWYEVAVSWDILQQHLSTFALEPEQEGWACPYPLETFDSFPFKMTVRYLANERVIFTLSSVRVDDSLKMHIPCTHVWVHEPRLFRTFEGMKVIFADGTTQEVPELKGKVVLGGRSVDRIVFGADEYMGCSGCLDLSYFRTMCAEFHNLFPCV